MAAENNAQAAPHTDGRCMEASRLSLALFIGSIGGGGAQRILCLLANTWAEAGHAVTVYHNDPALERFPFPQSELVTMRRLPLRQPAKSRLMARVGLVKDILLLRKTLLAAAPDHDVVLSFLPQANVMALLACLGTRLPVVITELCHPEHDVIGKRWELLRTLTYPLASAFVVQTTDIRNWFARRNKLSPTIIPNPVPDTEARWEPGRDGERKVIVAAARLTYQKNLTSLAEAFARLARKHPAWDLDIYGVGEEQEQLEAIIRENDLEGRLRLAGWTSNLGRTLAEAEMFVLSSRFEGMPMALTEAMAVGVPCISTDCPSGPADYIRNGENGLLVPVEDIDALASAMDQLMSDPALRIRLGENGRGIVDRFSLRAILPLWNGCLCKAMGKM